MRLGHLNLWKTKQQRDLIMLLTSTYVGYEKSGDSRFKRPQWISSTKSGIDGTTSPIIIKSLMEPSRANPKNFPFRCGG